MHFYLNIAEITVGLFWIIKKLLLCLHQKRTMAITSVIPGFEIPSNFL
jgi:hypothetical protein